jgi:tRNA pseudouridine55 synthase
VGRIRQVPPMFSAVHHEGRRLYELAREGVEVPREPREVLVHDIVVEAVAGAAATLRIVCGRGTYVRTLAADLGGALGCGAVVERLVRTRVGAFDLAQALAAEDGASATPDTLWSRLLPPESTLRHLGAVRLSAAAAAAFVHGQSVSAGPATEPAEATSRATPARFVRVHDEAGLMLGVGELHGGGRVVHPSRILHADRPGTRVLPA